VYLKSRRDELTSRNLSPFHSDYLRSDEVDVPSECEGAPSSETISPSTHDASAAAVEEVVA
jgi:hypothetical protein